ncbi:MAG: histone deacetylase family protein [Pseudomonadota bacterium]
MKTALISHSDFLKHITPEHVPERVARLEAIAQALADLPLMLIEAPLASDEDVQRCHSKEYIEMVRGRIPQDGFVCVDPGRDDETFLSPGSDNAIWRGVGGAIAAVDAVLAGDVENAFVAARPPGHHAERALAMGFCIFGNVAIAAKHALDHHRLDRVAIVDFDVHHGNGTQALLQDDPRVLFVSSHQMPLWPGTGASSDRGPVGTILNLPLSPRSTGPAMLAAYDRIVFPALAEFRPQLLLVSAGFDAHQDDPLADLLWTVADYKHLTRRLTDFAARHCDGRLVSVLEGGYDLDALAASTRAHVEELIRATE